MGSLYFFVFIFLLQHARDRLFKSSKKKQKVDNEDKLKEASNENQGRNAYPSSPSFLDSQGVTSNVQHVWLNICWTC